MREEIEFSRLIWCSEQFFFKIHNRYFPHRVNAIVIIIIIDPFLSSKYLSEEKMSVFSFPPLFLIKIPFYYFSVKSFALLRARIRSYSSADSSLSYF